MVEGVKMVEELLLSDLNIILLAATAEWEKDHPQDIQHSFYRGLKDRELQKMSNFSSSNQVLAVASLPQQNEFEMLDKDLVLVLDTIQDPGNLGTIIRTADWFGIDQILCSKETADAFNPKVVQASMGSVFRAKIHYANLAEILEYYQHTHRIYGSLLNGENFYEQDLTKSGFIIIGNESKGISPQITKLINQAIYIPKSPKSQAESLNAAVACSVILAEFKRPKIF